MLEQRPAPTNDTKARWLQRVADGLSISRAIAGPVAAAYIAKSQEYRTLPTVVAIGAIAATDYFDGRAADMAKWYRKNNVESERGAWLDQMADKAFVHGLVGGMAIHAAKHDDRVLAGTLAANQAVQFARDIWVTKIRAEAQEHGVPTGARWLGKVKTATTLIALTVKALPLPTQYETPQTWVANTGIAAGTALSVISGINLATALHSQIKNNSIEEPSFIAEPPAIRIFLDDTSQAL